MAEENVITKGSENWNIAQGYTYLKILQPLAELDKEMIKARFGVLDSNDSMMIPQEIKTNSRIEAIYRVVELLKQLIDNSYFACKQKNKEKLEEFQKEIKVIETYLPGIASDQNDQRTGVTVIVINEKHFNLCLDSLRKIKQDVNIPINESSLIFPASDEIDLDKFKSRLIEGG